MQRLARSATLIVFSAISLASCKDNGPQPLDPELIAALTITTQPAAPSQQAVQGTTELGLATPRDGWLYVPIGYDHTQKYPLMILLHGAGGDSDDWDARQYKSVADGYGVVLLAIDSRYPTWDAIQTPFFGVDVAFLDDALAFAFDRVNVDEDRISIAGFSDGASEAIGIGLANAGLITRVIAHSPGASLTPFARGFPKIYVTAGENDEVILLSSTSSVVGGLRGKGFTVEYAVFQAGHTIHTDARTRAFDIAIQQQ
jgi:phospholipase/carboxylesterase